MGLADEIENWLSKLEDVEAIDAIDCLKLWMVSSLHANLEGADIWSAVNPDGGEIEFYTDAQGQYTFSRGSDGPIFSLSSDLAQTLARVAIEDGEESSAVFHVLQHLLDVLIDYETAIGHLVVSHGLTDVVELTSLDHDTILDRHTELHRSDS